MSNLKKYNEKRNFKKTKEPYGKKKNSKTKKLKFVIQHHLARKDHYDFRLEWDGVYISFAVPKGPSWNPLDKRLALKVEDHPLSYGNFEGTIPKGEYGGGTVMLFDKGFWIPNKAYQPDFENGPVKFTLKGKRFMGDFSLVKIKDKHNKKENTWLLIKEKDDYVSNKSILEYKTSIKSGKTMDELANKNKYSLDDITITSPEKVIIKKGNITKEDIVNYYKLIAKRMMPFLNNRLISTIRCPNGTNHELFFMKHLNTKSKNIGKKIIKNKDGLNNDYPKLKFEPHHKGAAF